MRCPICGAKEGEKPFIGPFCVDCYEIKCKIPKKIEIVECVRCGRIRIRGEWKEANEEEIEEWVLAKCKGEDQPTALDIEKNELIFYIGGKEVRRGIKLTFSKTTCPTCSRISGGYYEAILQLRGNWKEIRIWIKRFKKALMKTTFISKEEELKEGINLYVGEGKKLLEVIKGFGLKWKTSRKLHGMKEGKRLYRTTYLIRFE